MIFSYSIKMICCKASELQNSQGIDSNFCDGVCQGPWFSINNLHISKEMPSWNFLLQCTTFLIKKVFLGRCGAQNYFNILFPLGKKKNSRFQFPSYSQWHFLIHMFTAMIKPPKKTRGLWTVNQDFLVEIWLLQTSLIEKSVKSPCKCCQATVKLFNNLIL